jgi:hypothetical protein
MEPLFINNLKQTKDVYLEMNKAYSSASRIAYQIAVPVIYGFLACFLIFYYGSYFSGAVIFAFGVLLFFYPLIKLHRIANKREKVFVELYGSTPEGQTLFYDDCLVSTNSADKSELKIEYGKIIKVRQSKNLYLLIMNQKLVIMVDKNRFKKGTSEEFEQFIKTKAVNAKIKI